MDSEGRRTSWVQGNFIVVVWMWLVCSVTVCCYIPLAVRPSASIDTLCLAVVHHPPLLLYTRTEVTSNERERKWASMCFIPYVLILGHKGGAFLATQHRLAGVYWSGCESCQLREKEKASNDREQKIDKDRERNGTKEKRKRGKKSTEK